MRPFPLRRGPLTLCLAGLLAVAGCGKGDGGGGLTDPPGGDPPGDPPPPPPPPPPATVPRGLVVYAVDNGNRLLVFGTENADTVSRLMSVTGVPILHRLIGIDFRPSDGRLYGVGNDSRVYVVDTLTGAATAVSQERFTPTISAVFDAHFAMGFDPATDRIRLISADFGGNWSIDPDDGTATLGTSPSYAAGDPNEGATPAIAGLAFTGPGGNAAIAARLRRAGGPDLCDRIDDLMYAMDVSLGELVFTCNAHGAEFHSLGEIPEITSLACADMNYDTGTGRLWLAAQRGVDYLNSIGSVEPETGLIIWHTQVPDNFLIQAITFKPKNNVLPGQARISPPAFRPAAGGPSLSAAAPEVDPVALCRGTGG